MSEDSKRRLQAILDADAARRREAEVLDESDLTKDGARERELAKSRERFKVDVLPAIKEAIREVNDSFKSSGRARIDFEDTGDRVLPTLKITAKPHHGKYYRIVADVEHDHSGVRALVQVVGRAHPQPLPEQQTATFDAYKFVKDFLEVMFDAEDDESV